MNTSPMLNLWNYFGPSRPAGIYNIGKSNERHGTLVQGIDYYDSKACIYQPKKNGNFHPETSNQAL